MGSNKTGDIARYVIIHDPTGYFIHLNIFTVTQFDATLQLGHWPTGSIWYVEVADESNFYAIIRGAQCEKQTRAIYKGPVKHFWPRGKHLV